MEHLTTRTGGESETQAGKLIPSFVIDTAGAPASAPAQGEGAAAAPEWIELLPAGVFYGRDGRGPFRLDDPAAVIASTTALQMNAGLPIDYDHATDFGAPEGRPAPAAGWIRELEVRGGAVWGRVEWTARAASSIVAREYRYVSPVFQFDPKDGVVTRLLRAGLTNNPNLHLTAIAASHTAAANNETKDEHMEFPSSGIARAAEPRGRRYALRTSSQKCASCARPAMRRRHSRLARMHTTPRITSRSRSSSGHSPSSTRSRRIARASARRIRWKRRFARAKSCRRSANGQSRTAPPTRAASRRSRPSSRRSSARTWALSGEPPADRRAGSLNAAELAICAQLGLKHSEFMRRKRGRADFLSLERADADLRNAAARSADLRNNQD